MTGELPDRVSVERCANGRLRRAYPVHGHDQEIRVDRDMDHDNLTAVLREAVNALRAEDPQCRRVVFAAPEGDLARLAAAEQAGFRFVVTVDLPDGSWSLTVTEPAWVTQVDMDLDHVPGT